MKTIRVFTVEVSECGNCPSSEFESMECLNDWKGEILASNRWIENVQGITPSCPRYAETKLIEVKG